MPSTIEPEQGLIVSVVVSLVSISILSSFLTQKYAVVKKWRNLPCAVWLVIGVYLDSFCFVFATAVLKYGLGLNTSFATCDAAILICLVAYVSTKLIYTFLVEKAYLIRGALVPRIRSKLWMFNTFGMLGTYCVVTVLNFFIFVWNIMLTNISRITRLDEHGRCYIGMERRALLPLIIFDLVVNVYLTSLFLIPLFSLYSFRNKERTGPVTKLHKMAVRTFVGSLCTLTSSIVNLSVLTALNGEPGWVCLLCCNSDVLFSAIMVYWVTFNDHAGSHRSRVASPNHSAAQNTNRPAEAFSSRTMGPKPIKPAHSRFSKFCRGDSFFHPQLESQTHTQDEPPQQAATDYTEETYSQLHHHRLSETDSIVKDRLNSRSPENIIVVMRRAGMSPAV